MIADTDKQLPSGRSGKRTVILAYVSLCLVTVVISMIGAYWAPAAHMDLLYGTTRYKAWERIRSHMAEAGETDDEVISQECQRQWQAIEAQMSARRRSYPPNARIYLGVVLGLIGAIYWGWWMQRRLGRGECPRGGDHGGWVGCFVAIVLHVAMSLAIADTRHGLEILGESVWPPFWSIFSNSLVSSMLFALPISAAAGYINGAAFQKVWYHIWPPAEKVPTPAELYAEPYRIEHTEEDAQ